MKNRADYYKTEKTHFNGRSFASQLEAALYGHLLILEKARELSNVRCQIHVYLTDARIGMVPDFVAFDHKYQEDVYFEAKGFETEIWLLKRKLWTHYGPGRLRVYKGSARSMRMVEEIIPKG